MCTDMEIVQVGQPDVFPIGSLVADFRVALKGYKGIRAVPDPEGGRRELQEYLDAGFPCFAARVGEEYAGYIVCRVEKPCVWVESIYAKPEYRRLGVASRLFQEAERLAASFGEKTVFNYVHPNNHGMIAFLRSHGYTVLNLVEIRKPYAGETPTQVIRVGEHWFDY